MLVVKYCLLWACHKSWYIGRLHARSLDDKVPRHWIIFYVLGYLKACPASLTTERERCMHVCVCMSLCSTGAQFPILFIGQAWPGDERERSGSVCVTLCVGGCVWSGLHASFSGWGYLLANQIQILPNLGVGGLCRFLWSCVFWFCLRGWSVWVVRPK